MVLEEVVIVRQGVLINPLGWQWAMGRQPEPLLQLRQAQPLALVGALQPGDHRLISRQPAAHMQGLHHQPGSGVTITAGAQLLPEGPPALIGKQLPLVAAVQQGSGLAAQGIDQVLQIDAPGPPVPFLLVAMHPRQRTGDLAAQHQLQPVVEDPHRHPLSDQPWRHRIHDTPHLDRAGAPHLELLDVVVGKAKRRQGPQGRLLLLQPRQPGPVVLLTHRGQEDLADIDAWEAAQDLREPRIAAWRHLALCIT